ncbi:PAS domain-containing sensor histidine kinase [Beijerinckia sp. L45]|uniref:PAS domain-containing sensor histidine kinase n=1 Tax=Beijerinckia sp. L45 TaxID=1641855 RepID=UPI00131E9166|nr:PAS domain-containing sensor histidine kinase [Beijerinckia sp. L45]
MKTSSSTDSPSVDLSILFSTLSHPYVAFERNLVVAAASEDYLRQTMTTRKDVIGRHLQDAFPMNPSGGSETLDAMCASIEEVFANGKKTDLRSRRYDIRRPDFDGTFEERYWNIQNVPLVLDASGAVAYVVQSIEDVTDSQLKIKNAEDRFRSAEERFEATFEQNAVGIALIAPDGHFLRINTHFGDLLGYDHDEILGKTIGAMTHPDDLEASTEQVAALLNGVGLPYTIEKRYIKKDGTPLWVRVTRTLVRDLSGKPAYFVAVAEDIADRKAAEAALMQREAYLQSILDTVPAGMIVIDHQGVIESFSRAAERQFGYAAGEVVGRNIKILMPSGDRERHDDYLQHFNRTGEARIIGKDRVVTGERKDGSTFSLNLSVGEISPGSRRHFVGFIQDLTDRQAAEARMSELQAELIHVSRFTALGEMASTLAHELNQPLTAITNFLKGSRRLLDQGGEAHGAMLSHAVDQAADQALRAGQIIRRLRAFVERGESERQRENLPKLIDEASALALLGAKEGGVRVSFALDPAAQTVVVDRIQIQQVLFNLMRNGIEAMQDMPIRNLQVATSLKTDGMVDVMVSDTGTGLAPDIASNLFRPFMTTKPTGMGFGLSICRTIVEANKGRISAGPNPGGGTIFRFTLPTPETEESGHVG